MYGNGKPIGENCSAGEYFPISMNELFYVIAVYLAAKGFTVNPQD